MSRPFRFKRFEIVQEQTPMKVGTDGVLLGAWAAGGAKIVDVGTGTGVVALMMAQRFGEAEVVGIDICDEAVEEARSNVERSPFGGRVKIERRDFKEMEDGKVDAIVCNPPYFAKSLKCPTEGRTMARHNETLSLEELFRGSRRMLNDGGVVSIVIPYMMMDEAIEGGRENGLYVTRAMRVRGNAEGEWKRVLLEFANNIQEWRMEEMTLEMERGVRTKEYAELTKEFYL